MSTEKTSHTNIKLNIKDVASMVGVSTTTIRNWEKYGLFTARRTPSGYRCYDFNDIETLKKIKKYMIDEHFSVSALKQTPLLNLIDPTANTDGIPVADTPEDTSEASFSGTKWKEARERMHYTLDDASTAIGISTSYLSKIENDLANPSYDLLARLADFYGETLIYFTKTGDSGNSLVLKNDENPIDLGFEGVECRQLSNLRERIMHPTIFTLAPGGKSNGSHHHRGEEFTYVLSGELRIVLNEKDMYVLKQGDSFSFKADIPHSYSNTTNKITTVLWVHCSV